MTNYEPPAVAVNPEGLKADILSSPALAAALLRDRARLESQYGISVSDEFADRVTAIISGDAPAVAEKKCTYPASTNVGV